MNQRPNRRRNRNNPYYLELIDNKYIITFIDSRNSYQKIAVSEEIYQAFNQFELNDLREMNQFDRHIEHSEVFEETLYHRALKKSESMENIIINKIILEKIYFCISLLSEVQQRRIKLYYFNELSLEKIASLEHSTHQAISKSIYLGIVKIQKMMKI